MVSTFPARQGPPAMNPTLSKNCKRNCMLQNFRISPWQCSWSPWPLAHHPACQHQASPPGLPVIIPNYSKYLKNPKLSYGTVPLAHPPGSQPPASPPGPPASIPKFQNFPVTMLLGHRFRLGPMAAGPPPRQPAPGTPARCSNHNIKKNSRGNASGAHGRWPTPQAASTRQARQVLRP